MKIIIPKISNMPEIIRGNIISFKEELEFEKTSEFVGFSENIVTTVILP